MTEPVEEAASRRRAKVFLAAVALFAYALWFRVAGISADFWMMNDQIGDWDLVQGPLSTLPLTGPAKTGGGTHLGPAYYWWLWGVRHLSSPWIGRLPHAMGVAGSALDAFSFALLLVALAARGVPLVAAAAAVLLAATVPYEAALARAGWNPNFSLACVDLALAVFLVWRDRSSLARAALVAGLAWIGAASHMSAIAVALALFAALVAEAARASAGAALRVALAIAAVVCALQAPRLLAPATAGDADTAVTRGVAALLARPATLLSPRGLAFVARGAPELLLRSTSLPLPAAEAVGGAVLAAVAFGLVRRRVDPALALVPLLSLATAALAYTILLEALPTYFLIALLGVLAALVAAALGALPDRARGAAGWLALALVLAAQPQRWRDRQWDHSYPLYAAVVRGAAELARSGVAVRRADGPADAAMPTQTTPLVRWLGGKVEPDARAVARIGRDGVVSIAADP